MTVAEMNILLERFTSRFDQANVRISKLEDKTMKTIQSAMQ